MRDVAYIALGSNLGDRAAYLARGREGLASLPHSRLLAVSSVEETEPVGPADQPRYLNQMAALETELEPLELLEALHAIEEAAGRTRRVRWGPRTLDLDIVLFERQTVCTDRLVVPHPELGRRDFWRSGLSQLRAAS